MSPEKQRDWSPSTRKAWLDYCSNEMDNIDRLCISLRNRTYQPGEFNIFEKKEGSKIRRIYESAPEDLIVDTLYLDCLNYIFLEKKHIVHPNCYGSIKGKGQHDIRKKIIDTVHRRTDLFVYIGDTSKYYPTMNHEVLMQIFRQHIKDEWMLWLCDMSTKRISGERGIALGLPSSNPIGHIYHSIIDWMITIEYGVRRYFRFCDDKWIFHRDVNYLHTLARVVRDETERRLCQYVKPSWRIVRCKEERFECLGAMINSHGARLRTISRRRIERLMVKRIREDNPDKALNTWSGVKGSLRDLNVGNLIGFWHDKYPEFFALVREAYRLAAIRKMRAKRHLRIEIILTQAKDCRCKENKTLYPYGPDDNTPREAA